MIDLTFVALLPRLPGVSLEHMVVELWVARTGREPSEKEWEQIQPLLKDLENAKRPFILRSNKFRG